MPIYRTHEVVESMVGRILSVAGQPNRLMPGQFLSRGELEYHYQVAPQTSRAVIAELVALGLVEIRAGGRAYVPDITPDNLGDLAEVAERLELSAISYLVYARMGRRQLPTVVQASPTVTSCVKVDIDFHAEIVRRAGSEWHWRSFQAILAPLKLCLIQLGRSLGPAQLLEDNESLLQACVGARDSSQAAGVLSIHWVRVASLCDLGSVYLKGVDVIS